MTDLRMTKPVPRQLDRLHIGKFKSWLAAGGATILEPTNPWEVVRYRLNEPLPHNKTVQRTATHIVYRKASGSVTWTGGSYEHYRRMISGYGLALQTDVDVPPARKNRPRKRYRTTIVQNLLDRDGNQCWYCSLPLDEDITLEHLLSMRIGGGNHIDNLVLAHKQCNQLAGHKSLGDKIQLKIELTKQEDQNT